MSDAAAVAQTAIDAQSKSQAVEAYILHHVGNTTSWHIPGLFNLTFEFPTFTLHALMLLFAAALLIYAFCIRYRKEDAVPTGLTNLLETFVVFIRDDICISCLGEKDGRQMAPLFLSFFFFILTLNLMGLIPIFASATGNVNVTGGLAVVSFLFMTVGAIVRNGFGGFMSAFIPHGVPWPVLIMLVPIEMVGVVIKCVALTIRLFANMLAGHIVISALIGLVVTFGLWALPAAGLAVGIYLLKILVAFLQAYIFTLLSALFIGQIYHPAH
jgi:F-type H+-transporting ATPase subunit a